MQKFRFTLLEHTDKHTQAPRKPKNLCESKHLRVYVVGQGFCDGINLIWMNFVLDVEKNTNGKPFGVSNIFAI